MATHERVAVAWRFGRAAESDHMHTNGTRVWSYGHLIGDTIGDMKVAYCCHYSNSTATHCGSVLREADDVRECPEYGRPDLHKKYPRELARRECHREFGAPCAEGSKSARTCWAANPDADCVFRCLRCEKWHPGNCYSENGELKRNPCHPGGWHPGDSSDHELRYQCRSCEKRVSRQEAKQTWAAFNQLIRDTEKERKNDVWSAYIAVLALPPQEPNYSETGEWSHTRWVRARMHNYDNNAVICSECHQRATAATQEMSS